MSDKKEFDLSEYELVSPETEFSAQGQRSVRVVKIEAIPQLDKEIAVHEASHLVFNLVFEKLDLQFTGVESVYACSKEKVDGSVCGFHPHCAKTASHLIDNFYIENEMRSLVKILSTVAGYASYNVFIDSQEKYFISVKGKPSTMAYHSMESLPASHKCQDIRWLRTHIDKFFKSKVNTDDKIRALFSYAQKVMEIKAVQDSITFASEFILKNECNEIVGEDLNKLVTQIRVFTEPVDAESILAGLEEILQ